MNKININPFDDKTTGDRINDLIKAINTLIDEINKINDRIKKLEDKPKF